MNIKRNLLLALLLSVILPNIQAAPRQMELNSGWRFKQWRLTNWYPATVPGVVHTDLMANGIIEDPFFRLNERSVQWVDKEDWMYETHFDVPAEMLDDENIRLHFMGIDTYGTVYLNGEQLGETDNMFREWKFDVKGKLKATDNKLEVMLTSPIKKDIPKFDALPYHYSTGPDQSAQGGIFDKTVSPFARKAGYHYGWDWGPRLVTSGIWRPVYVESWSNARLENVFIHQKNITEKQAYITFKTEIASDREQDATLVITDGQSGQTYGTADIRLAKGLNLDSVEVRIANPQLWWCNGWGEPHLYTFKTEVRIAGQTADSNTDRTGLRSLKVISKEDQYGKSLYFELNGHPVFAKGANYIPCDNFLPRVTKDIYRKTVQDAVDANMNMLRVWGGGSYEDDYFYQLCDEQGIMVWQDFMFACGMWPAEGHFLENVKQEAIDNIKRLRNRACIGIWCGNNESYDGWFGWGRREDYARQNPDYARVIWRQYTDLFHKLLPDMVAEYAPGMTYWPSSPYGESGKACNATHGDRHYWEVWHGRQPISAYTVERSRFFSEYGFQSFPEFESVKIYAPNPEDWAINSEVMMDHQRAGDYANNLIKEYLLKEYRQPKDFRAFLYMNHVLQGDAIKIAMEAHRRDMPYCMGTLFWQHNDCWPVASWASRDYYGRWKAQHYFARAAYRDVLVSPIEKDGKLSVYLVSDRLKASKGKLSLRILRMDGTVVGEKTLSVSIPVNASKAVYTEAVDKLLKGAKREDVVVHAALKDNAGKEYTNNYFLVQQKYMNYPQATISHSIRPQDGGYAVTLESDKFARAVFLSIDGIDNFFSDNYFDLLPGEKTTISVQTGLSVKEFEKQLKVVSLYDGYVTTKQ